MKKALIIAALACSPSLLSASEEGQFVFGTGYWHYSAETANLEVDLEAAYVSLGYEFPSYEPFKFVTDLKIGGGIVDDVASGAYFDIEEMISLSLRGEYDLGSHLYVFGNISYTYLSLEGTSVLTNAQASENDFDFGYGAGIGVNFTQKLSLEVSAESYGDDEYVYGGSLRFKF